MSHTAIRRLERQAERLRRLASDPDTTEDRREAAFARLAEIDAMRWTPSEVADGFHFASL